MTNAVKLAIAVWGFFALATVVIFMLPANAAPDDNKHQPLSIIDLNNVVDSSNFIVNGGCSGTLISTKHRLVMTAHHCIDKFIKWVSREVVVDGEVKKKKTEVRRDVPIMQKIYKDSTQVGGSSYKARIVGYSDLKDGHDLALLQIVPEKISMSIEVPILPKGRDTIRGERVYVVGNPAGLDASVTQGIIVSATREYKSKTGNVVRLLQTDAEIFFGNSGGVLMSADGFYLGTVSRGIPGTAVVFAIHYSHVRDMLKDNCYAEIFDSEADTFAECKAKRDSKEKQKEKSVKDLLEELIKAKSGG